MPEYCVPYDSAGWNDFLLPTKKTVFCRTVTLSSSSGAQYHTALKIQQGSTPELKPESLLQCFSKESRLAGVFIWEQVFTSPWPNLKVCPSTPFILKASEGNCEWRPQWKSSSSVCFRRTSFALSQFQTFHVNRQVSRQFPWIRPPPFSPSPAASCPLALPLLSYSCDWGDEFAGHRKEISCI